MKRFHVNVSVTDMNQSIDFYSTLFGAGPDVKKHDYAKWMLDDPRINFSIAASSQARGINHVGLQADTVEELAEIRARLRAAGAGTFDQADAECCYANSDKTWVRDPDDVAWETFVTHGSITHYGDDHVPKEQAAVDTAKRCCA